MQLGHLPSDTDVAIAQDLERVRERSDEAPGRPAVADQRDAAAALESLQEIRQPSRLVERVIAHQAGGQTMAREKDPGPARVLAGDEVARGEGLDGPRREIVQVADRRPDDEQRASRLPAGAHGAIAPSRAGRGSRSRRCAATAWR